MKAGEVPSYRESWLAFPTGSGKVRLYEVVFEALDDYIGCCLGCGAASWNPV